MEENILPAEVTLSVDSMSVLEDSGKALKYTFNRTGDTTNSLTINFTLGGTATLDTDYKQMGAEFESLTKGKVIIAAGETEAIVTITTIADTEIESDETIMFTLTEGDYIIDDNPQILAREMEIAPLNNQLKSVSSNEDVMVMSVISNDDPKLSLDWGEQFGSNAPGYEFLAVDNQGNTYVTGDFLSPVTVDDVSLTSQGDSDVFVAKLDKDGKFDWVKSFGTTNKEEVEDIAVDTSGNVYFSGTFKNSISSNESTVSGGESNDIFVTKLATNGDQLWSKNFGGTNNDKVSGIDVDGQGNIYLTGESRGEIKFGTPLVTSLLDYAFAAKLDINGDGLWVNKLGENNTNHFAQDIVVDQDSNSYQLMTGVDKKSITVTQFDQEGTKGWEKKFVNSSYVEASDIVIDNQSNTFITGQFEERLQFGNTSLEGGDNGDVFVAKLDSEGDVLWAKDFDIENDNNVKVESIAVDEMGDTYVTGYYYNKSMTIDNFMLYSEGGEGGEGENAFITKIDSTGEVKWAQNIAGTNTDAISDIAVKNGKIYIAGTFYQEATFEDKILTTQNQSDSFLVALAEDKPEISFTVSSNNIIKGSENPVSYTFTRTGKITAALTIDFTISGSATFNEDYTLTGSENFDGSKGKITFKAGENTATVTLNITSGTSTVDETIALSLETTRDYKVATTDISMSTITITNNSNNDDDDDDENSGGMTGNDDDDDNDDNDNDDDDNDDDDDDENSGGITGDDDDDDDDDDGDDDGDDEGKFTLTSKSNKSFAFKGGKSSIKFSFKSKTVQEIKEIGFFTVDDEQGTIDGISPDDEKYIEVALKRAQSIFSILGNAPQGFDTNIEKILEFSSDTNFRFFSVKNGTIDGVKKGQIQLSQLSFSSANFLQISEVETNGFDLDFEGVKINMKLDGKAKKAIGSRLQERIEVLDFRSTEITIKQKATFTIHREATFNNVVGFFKVADENGGIDTNGDGVADILVGQEGYAKAAVESRITNIELSVQNQSTASFTGEFEPGAIFVPFLIVDGTFDTFTDIYFPFLGANSDAGDHVMMLGDNIFGFEDLKGGGDRDFNDIIVKIDFSLNT
ncbi:MAG: SBBP repeat-containing protein [Nostocales cyanobacterium 94392]|nr:SBBP repeat-containing protein [Nostocales cyanobacterium 94392]